MKEPGLSRLANRVSIALILVYLMINIAGPLFINEMLGPLGVAGDYDFNIRLLMCLPASISSIIPICFSLLLYSISKSYGYRSAIWMFLGLLMPLAAIILLHLVYYVDNRGINYKLSDINKVVRNIVILLILGFAIKYADTYLKLVPFLERILSERDTNQIIYFHTETLLSAFNTINILIVNVAVAIWINNESKIKKYNPKVWTLFGLFGGLFAPILFYLFGLIKQNDA